MSYDLTPGETEGVELKPNGVYFRYALKSKGVYYGLHTGKALRRVSWNHAKRFNSLQLGKLKNEWLGFTYIEQFKGYGIFNSSEDALLALGNAARNQTFNTVILKVKAKGEARLVYCSLSGSNCLIVDSIKIIGEHYYYKKGEVK